MSIVGILSKFHKQVGLNKGYYRKAVPYKRVGWEKNENANQVDLFIWHLITLSLQISNMFYTPSKAMCSGST